MPSAAAVRPPHPPAAASRRALLGALLGAALGGPALLAGCGFRPRRPPEMAFTRIALAGFAERSPLAAELRRSLPATVRVVASPAEAELVLHALAERRDRSVVASTAAGQVRELALRLRFGFRAATPGGRELMPASELLLERDLTTTESAALAKAQEEAELFAAMQTDIVQQLLRRLASVPAARLSAPATAPTAASAPATAR